MFTTRVITWGVVTQPNDCKNNYYITERDYYKITKITARLLKDYCKITARLLQDYCKITERLLKDY